MICLRIGKTYKVKTPLGNFKVTTPENPLLSKQTVTNKGISVPYTNLQLNLYPNTQLDLFCSNNLSFSMHGSRYATNQLCKSQYATSSPTWEECWLQSSSVHPTMKIKKLIGYKTLRCTNTAASSKERWTRANFVSSHNLYEQNFASHLCNLCNLWRLLK